MISASFIAKHGGGSATQKFLLARGATCARAQNRRPTPGRQSLEIHVGACSAPHAPTAIGASFISKHDGGSAQKFLWPGVGRFLHVRKSSVQHEEGRVARNSWQLGACSARTRPQCDWGIIYFQTRWRQRYTEIPLARRGRRCACAVKSSVQHEEGSVS
jgi:hypothetical protein